uniref:Uncharacterized protein n=1 Tax=Romanomermis culicivorax TaxID=13658 RepID=A0A915HYS3_ROMCU
MFLGLEPFFTHQQNLVEDLVNDLQFIEELTIVICSNIKAFDFNEISKIYPSTTLVSSSLGSVKRFEYRISLLKGFVGGARVVPALANVQLIVEKIHEVFLLFKCFQLLLSKQTDK